MNPIALFFSALLLTSPQMEDDSINSILGDASWVAVHGALPGASAGERARIQTHLAFVEAFLRSADPSTWTEPQRARRARSLDTLAAYRRAGIFPRRTGDEYAGRRPRFIDDRGVHCAVGHLVAKSGAPEVAAAIQAAHEYAYIDEIDAPALAAWASENGFTPTELAMIQPGYAAVPDEAGMRLRIEAETDAFTLACAALHEPTRSFTLRVSGDDHGAVGVRTRSRNDFAECFAEKANALENGHGAYDREPSSFRFRMEVHVRMPQEILAERISEGPLNSACLPRPGVDPEIAYARIRVGVRGPDIAVRTVPRNREVDQCIAQTLRDALRDFAPGRYRLQIRRRFTLPPAIDAAALARSLEEAPTHATECHPQGAPARVRVVTRAVPGAEEFEVEIEGGTPAFQTCLRAKVQQGARAYLSVSRQLPDGHFERYFRIDAAAEASTAFEVETPHERAERVARERQEFEERMARDAYR